MSWPIAEMYIASANGTSYYYQYAVADTGGNFSLPIVPANVPMTLYIYRPNASVIDSFPNIEITSDGQTLTENVALPGDASATVTVESAASQPVQGAEIYLTDSEHQDSYMGSTNSSGQLAISTIAGSYAVGASAYSSTTGTYVYAGGAKGTVTAAQDGGSIQILIQAPTSKGTVNGHVYGGSGTTPLTNFFVSLLDAGSGTTSRWPFARDQ